MSTTQLGFSFDISRCSGCMACIGKIAASNGGLQLETEYVVIRKGA